MSEADGRVYIDTELDTDGMKLGSKEIEDHVRRMAKTVAASSEKQKLAFQRQTNAFIKQNQAIAKQQAKVAELEREYEELSAQKVETEAFKKVNAEITKLEKSLEKAIESQIRFMETGGKKDSRTFERMEYDISHLSGKLDEARAKKAQLESSGSAYQAVDTSGVEEKLIWERQALANMNNTLGLSCEELKMKVNAATSAQKKQVGIGGRLKNALSKVGTAAKNAATQMGNLHKNTNKTGMSMGKMLGTSLLFSMVFRAISVAAEGIRTGFENLAQSSGTTNNSISMLMSSLTQLKNSLATAFSPILTVVAPIISSFINMLSKAITYIGMFFAALTGQSSFKKAVAVQEDYAAGLKDTASGAKEAEDAMEGYLSPLDEINKMEKQDTDTASAGSGGGGGGTPVSEMFETVPIEQKFKDLVSKLKEMMQPLADAWDIYGDSIKEKLSLIGQDFKDFFSEIGTATYDWAKNLNWEPLLASVDSLLAGFEPLIDTILDGLSWAYQNVLLPFGTWTIEEGLPALLNALGKAFEAINAILVALAPAFTWLFENAIVPFADMIGEIVVQVMNAFGGLMDFITGVFTGNWDLAFSGLGTIVESLGNIFLAQFGYIESILNTFDSFLQNVFAVDFEQYFGPIFGGIMNNFVDKIEALWNTVMGIFDGALKFIKSVFAGDWQQAWEGIKEVFSAIWDGIVELLRIRVNGIISIINSVISAVVSGFNGLLSVLNTLKIPDNIPGVGGMSFNFPMATAPQIPYLATGAAIPPNAPFMAMLGDQKHGKNLEMPESLLRQVVREESGGGKGGNYRFVAEINRRTLFEEMITEAKMRQSQNGRNPFELA